VSHVSFDASALRRFITRVRWAQEINNVGVAAFLLDSFSTRGIISTVDDHTELDSLAMIVDAEGTLTGDSDL